MLNILRTAYPAPSTRSASLRERRGRWSTSNVLSTASIERGPRNELRQTIEDLPYRSPKMPKLQITITALSDSAGYTLPKTLRIVAGLSFGHSRALYRYLLATDDRQERFIHLPCVLIAGVTGEVAEHAANLLRDAGATVTVEESTIPNPMLPSPRAGHRYQWNWLIGPRRI